MQQPGSGSFQGENVLSKDVDNRDVTNSFFGAQVRFILPNPVMPRHAARGHNRFGTACPRRGVRNKSGGSYATWDSQCSSRRPQKRGKKPALRILWVCVDAEKVALSRGGLSWDGRIKTK